MKWMIFVIALLVFSPSPGHPETYQWVDEKGNVHFTDDPSTIPDRYRSGAQSRKAPRETAPVQKEEKSATVPASAKSADPSAIEVPLVRRGEVSMVDVVLNGREKQQFILDTGASFTNISRQAAANLGIVIDENTPFLPVATASDIVLNPLVTLRSVSVGKAEVANVDALVHTLPGDVAGLLGNSFLGRFRVTLDPRLGKMTLVTLEGAPSPARPGGYGKDYWVGRFQFYHRTLEGLKKTKAAYERQEMRADVSRINNAIRHFENQLSELDRKASFAGVPQNWRQ
jgi:clan AA aspartic protease (TIGR02281 family)